MITPINTALRLSIGVVALLMLPLGLSAGRSTRAGSTGAASLSLTLDHPMPIVGFIQPERFAASGWVVSMLPAGFDTVDSSATGAVLLREHTPDPRNTVYITYWRWLDGNMERLEKTTSRRFEHGAYINDRGEIASAKIYPESPYNFSLVKVWVPTMKSFEFSWKCPLQVHKYEDIDIHQTFEVGYATADLMGLDGLGKIWVLREMREGEQSVESIDRSGQTQEHFRGAIAYPGASGGISKGGHWYFSYGQWASIIDGVVVWGFPANGISANGIALYSSSFGSAIRYPDGTIDDGPNAQNPNWIVTWVDDQDRLVGIRLDEAGNRISCIFTRKKDSDGELVIPSEYEFEDFVPFILANGWTTDHLIAPGAISPQLGLAKRTRGDGSVEERAFLALRAPQLAVDADRDGTIKLATEDASDATSAENPYRFWLNDDDDTEGTLMMDGLSGPPFDEADKVPATVADYTKHKISSQRNLEDFARLWIDMTGLQAMVTTSGGIQVGLKWQNTTGTTPAINVYLSADPTGSDSYLKSDQAAFNQVGILVANNNAITFANNKQTIDTSDTFVFPADLLQTQLQKSPVLHLLFEGAGVGTGQLVLVLLDKNGAEIGVGPGVWFDLMNIKSMYERAVATTGGPRSENGVDYTIPLPHDLTGPDDNNIPHPSMGWEPNPLGYPYEPDPAEIKTYIVYVHGWRWSPEKANNRTETVFKRLWHLGYKGRLAALRWPTFYGGSDDGDDNLPGDLGGVFTYNDSEYRAWKSGESLKLYVNQLTSGYARYVVAHSMGNIVAGSALKSGMSVAKYVMLNAAVPAMCYDENTSLRQADWNYTTPNTDADAGTRALGYIGQLGTLNTNVVNFFLSNDSATLDMWNINNNVWRPQRYNLRTTGYAYDPAEIVGRRLYITFFTSFGRYLIDPQEAMPYACQSLTRTAGADGRTRGSIQSTVDMDASFGFGTSHGAEWDRNYQATRAFYQQLLITLNSAP